MDNDKIIIYQTEDGQTKIDVRLENDTVWLTQAQMAELFEKDQSVVARHINNAIKDGELDESNMHFLHNTQYKYRPTKIYDLDVIISVGYRVHSKRGTAFRIWARKIIKDYLVKGYAVNERIRKEQIGELRQLVGMLGRTIQNQPLLSNDETNALFEVKARTTPRNYKAEIERFPPFSLWFRKDLLLLQGIFTPHTYDARRA
jgi:hypothetical protein